MLLLLSALPAWAETFTKQVTDSAGVIWALRADTRIWRNGVLAAGGLATDLFVVNGMIQVTGMDGRRWGWVGTQWEPLAPALAGPCSVNPVSAQSGKSDPAVCGKAVVCRSRVIM